MSTQKIALNEEEQKVKKKLGRILIGKNCFFRTTNLVYFGICIVEYSSSHSLLNISLATGMEVSDLVTDLGAVVSKVVPMAYRGNCDLDISGAQQPAGASRICPYCVKICKSAEEKDEHVATSHKDVEKLKNYQLKRIEESNIARDKPKLVKQVQMNNSVWNYVRKLICDKCQKIFYSSIHLRAHHRDEHILFTTDAEAAYTKPDHHLKNCTSTSVSPCMYHPRLVIY